jgi:hypothetical protein
MPFPNQNLALSRMVKKLFFFLLQKILYTYFPALRLTVGASDEKLKILA